MKRQNWLILLKDNNFYTNLKNKQFSDKKYEVFPDELRSCGGVTIGYLLSQILCRYVRI